MLSVLKASAVSAGKKDHQKSMQIEFSIPQLTSKIGKNLLVVKFLLYKVHNIFHVACTNKLLFLYRWTSVSLLNIGAGEKQWSLYVQPHGCMDKYNVLVLQYGTDTYTQTHVKHLTYRMCICIRLFIHPPANPFIHIYIHAEKFVVIKRSTHTLASLEAGHYRFGVHPTSFDAVHPAGFGANRSAN